MENLDDLLPTSLRERFQPLGILGEGASSIVLRARQLDLDRQVVLKILRVGLGEEGRFRERFQREARLLASVSHPHVLPLLDYGIREDRAFMVYPDSEGIALDELFPPSHPMPLPELVQFLDQILAGLGELHRSGIVHRDVKPANILGNPDGSWQLFDLGLARIELDSQGLTRTGEVVGTPLFMAPEAIHGLPPSPLDDLYSLGVTAYSLATGRNPFLSSTVQGTLGGHLALHPPALGEVLPGIPGHVSDLVSCLLSKERSGRPESAEAARAHLEVLPENPRSTGHQSRPPPPGVSSRGPGLSGRAVLAGAAGTLLFLGFWFKLPSPAPPTAPLTLPSAGSESPPRLSFMPRVPRPSARWRQRLEEEFQSQASELPRDPRSWEEALAALPVTRELLAAFTRGELEVPPSPPLDSQLRDLGASYRALGFHDPFDVLVSIEPREALPEPGDHTLLGLEPTRARPYPGWSGTSVHLYRSLAPRIASHQTAVRAFLASRDPGEHLPATIRARLATYRPMISHLRKGRMIKAMTLLWADGPGTRQALLEWLGPSLRDVDRLTQACLHACNAPGEEGARATLRFRRLLHPMKTLTYSPSFLVPPGEGFPWQPVTSHAHLAHALLLARVRKRRAEAALPERIPLGDVLEAVSTALSNLPAGPLGPEMLVQGLELLLHQCEEFQRPDLLASRLEILGDTLVLLPPAQRVRFGEDLDSYLRSAHVRSPRWELAADRLGALARELQEVRGE